MSGQTFTEMLARWRKYCGRFTTGLVGLLALLALDDITTGKEPSFLPEWLTVVLAFVWFLTGATIKLRRWRRAST